MSDHYYSLNPCTDDSIIYHEDIESASDVIIEEKVGDDYLIELYRERKHLYDKNDNNFKDKQMKENAWMEISTSMQQRNLGKHYTPEYCQARCTSLRDQYSREKRNIENEYKSGNASSKRKPFAFFSQLSFLDNFIKKRNTFTNVRSNKNATQSVQNSKILSHCKLKNSDQSTSGSESEKYNVPQKENMSKLSFQNQDNLIQDNNKYSQEINTSKYKKRKIDEKKSIDDTFTDISNTILNFLENSKENTTHNLKTPDQSFAEYVRSHLEHMSEPEKAARKKLIIDALTTPLHNM